MVSKHAQLILIFLSPLICMETLLENNFAGSLFATSEGWSMTKGTLGYGIVKTTKTIFGGVNYFGIETQIQKGFVIPPQYMIRIQLTIWTIGRWENGEINILCEENRIFSQSLYSMLDLNYSEPISLNIVITHNAGTAIIQARPTSQTQHSQAWGIRDFSILYYACPSGCVTCSLTDKQTCSQWVLGYSQFAQLSITVMTNEGWFVNDDKEYFRFNQCNGLPFFGNFGSGMILKRTFFFASHDRIKIQFLWVKLNDFGQAKFFITVDGVIQQQITYKTDVYHNINYCDNDTGLDSIQRFTVDFSHTSQLANIEISTTLSQTQLVNSFGIRDFTIFTSKCDTCTQLISFQQPPTEYFTETSFTSSNGWIIQQLIDEKRLKTCGKTIYGQFGISMKFIILTIKLHSVVLIRIWTRTLLMVYKSQFIFLESFGMRDFKIKLADCSFKCLSCNTISGDHCQFQYRDEYWNLNETIFSGGDGWSQQYFRNPPTQVTQCNEKSILGGLIKNQSYLKLVLTIDLHIRLRIIFNLYIIGDWLGDEIVVTINESQFYRKRITTSYANFYCQPNLQAFIINFDRIIQHDSNSLEIYITNTIDLFPTNNKSFGIRDVEIYTSPV